MKSSIKNFYTGVVAFLLPIISVLVTVLILYIPRDNGYWNVLRQAPFYAGIYFWQSQRPDTFSIFSAFILGVMADVWGGGALGINVMSFLLLYIVSVQFSRRFNVQRFSYSWLLFATAMFVTLLFKGLMVSVFFRRLIPLYLLAVEWGLVFAMYPILARVYIWAERRYIPLEERYEKI